MRANPVDHGSHGIRDLYGQRAHDHRAASEQHGEQQHQQRRFCTAGSADQVDREHADQDQCKSGDASRPEAHGLRIEQAEMIDDGGHDDLTRDGAAGGHSAAHPGDADSDQPDHHHGDASAQALGEARSLERGKPVLEDGEIGEDQHRRDEEAEKGCADRSDHRSHKPVDAVLKRNRDARTDCKKNVDHDSISPLYIGIMPQMRKSSADINLLYYIGFAMECQHFPFSHGDFEETQYRKFTSIPCDF